MGEVTRTGQSENGENKFNEVTQRDFRDVNKEICIYEESTRFCTGKYDVI